MPIDVLNEEVRGLSDEQIKSVVLFVRNLKGEGSVGSEKKGFPLPPGYFSSDLKFMSDDFDTYIPEGFEEYM